MVKLKLLGLVQARDCGDWGCAWKTWHQEIIYFFYNCLHVCFWGRRKEHCCSSMLSMFHESRLAAIALVCQKSRIPLETRSLHLLPVIGLSWFLSGTKWYLNFQTGISWSRWFLTLVCNAFTMISANNDISKGSPFCFQFLRYRMAELA